jgi:chorismate synthase
MPIVFSSVVKPTPSISKEQRTINIETKENSDLTVIGRHDPAIIHRVRAVVNAATALVIADLLTMRFGTDWLGE